MTVIKMFNLRKPHITTLVVLSVLLGSYCIIITILTTDVRSNTGIKKQDHQGSSPKLLSRASSSSSSTPMQRHIREQCSRHGLPTTLKDDFNPKLFGNLIVDDKHKLIYCPIAKVACTTWKRIFLVLTGKVGTKNPMDIPPDDVHHKHAKLFTYLSNYPKDQILHRLRTYFKFVFVREPFERILSAYRNKFDVAYSPKSYFHNTYARNIIQWYRGKSIQTGDTTLHITFSEFVEFLIDPNRPIHYNAHWQMFHKACLPCVIDYDFVGRLETVDKDSDFIVRKNGLNEFVKFPNRTDAKYKHKKSGDVLKHYYSKISSSKIMHLYDTYKVDFDIFKYALPKDVKMLMNRTFV